VGSQAEGEAPFTEKVYFLDCNLKTLDEAMARIQEDLDLR
jgi:hypothetical protein